ncbi:MAG: glycosyl hydrolase family 28-related protein, partial [Bacteroidia bacterium]
MHFFKNKLTYILILWAANAFGQNVGISTTGAIPDSSAALDIDYDNKGFLLPRVALTASNSPDPVSEPAVSLLVYNTATVTGDYAVSPGFYYWNGTRWVTFKDDNSLDCINIVDLGAQPNNQSFDNTSIIQDAIDSAAITGSVVCIPQGSYTNTGTITIPAGVTIQGAGVGNNPTLAPNNTGSSFRYTGTDWALKVTGAASHVSNLNIQNGNNGATNNGILIQGDDTVIADLVFDRVSVYGFTEGYGLKLEAIDGGAVTSSSFRNIRIRHAKVGIEIDQNNVGYAFVNSNTFHRTTVSGGSFDYGVHVKSGNNNVFHGLIVEPTSSALGHVVVDSAATLAFHDVRIEATDQGAGIPLLHFKNGSRGSTVTGMVSGGYIFNNGLNDIGIRGDKMLNHNNLAYNVLLNSSFNSVDTTSQTITFWEFTNASNTHFEVLEPAILPMHNVLEFSNTGTTKLSIDYALNTLAHDKYKACSFGFYAKCSSTDTITATIHTDATNLVSSMIHPGDNKWHFISIHANIDQSTFVTPEIHLKHQTGAAASKTYITTPTLSFGSNTQPQLEAPFLSSSGGTMTGVLTGNLVTVDSTDFRDWIEWLNLPVQSNLFIVDATRTIRRINHTVHDRMKRGTVITLMFNANVTGQ